MDDFSNSGVNESRKPPSAIETDQIPVKSWQEWRYFLYDNFEISLSEKALLQFKAYLRELKIWNEKMNLVSFHSPEEILWRHFADSLAGLKFISELSGKKELKSVDIGTGAGFPGIPIKIASPLLDLTLVESITKKCTFLEHLIQMLNLEDIKIINNRSENIGQQKKHRYAYDIVLSRAVSKLSANLEFALPLLRKGGFALIYKTEESAFGKEGIKSAERALQAIGAVFIDKFCYTISGQKQKFCILGFKKSSDTPALYPRRPGMPEKKPL